MRKIPLLPNAVTAFALSCGLYAIFKMTLMGSGEIFQSMQMSIVTILLLAGFADLLDGALARFLRAQSAFGFMFDSLSDAVTFGVVPSVFVLKSIPLIQGSGSSYFVIASALIYSVCGVLRLVRFSLEMPESSLLPTKSDFIGLPIPAGAIAVVSAALLLDSADFQSLFQITAMMHTALLCGVMVFVGYLMISRWRFPSVKVLHIHVPSFYLVFLTAIGAVTLLYGIFNHFSLVLFCLSWSYLLVAWGLALYRRFSGGLREIKTQFEKEKGPE